MLIWLFSIFMQEITESLEQSKFVSNQWQFHLRSFLSSFDKSLF